MLKKQEIKNSTSEYGKLLGFIQNSAIDMNIEVRPLYDTDNGTFPLKLTLTKDSNAREFVDIMHQIFNRNASVKIIPSAHSLLITYNAHLGYAILVDSLNNHAQSLPQNAA